MDNPDPTIPNAVPEPTGQNPAPGEAVPAIPAVRPCLWLAWKIRLVEDTIPLAVIKGREKLDLFERPDQVLSFLKSCDERFDTRIALQMISVVRARYLGKRGESEAFSDAEVAVKAYYDIKVSVSSGPLHETKGSLETMVKPDPQSIRGYLGLIERSWRQTIFNPAKTHLRQVAANVVERFGVDESTEAALKQIDREIRGKLKPDVVPSDEIPPTVPSIEVSGRQAGFY